MKYRKWIRLMTPLPAASTGFRAHVLCADIPRRRQDLFVYDASVRTGSRKAYGTFCETGKDRDRSNCHVSPSTSIWLVTSRMESSGELSRDVFDDGGLPIVWGAYISRIISRFQAPVFRELVINMERGVGLVDGSVPKIYLDWSDDGGHTWSSKREASMELSATTADGRV